MHVNTELMSISNLQPPIDSSKSFGSAETSRFTSSSTNHDPINSPGMESGSEKGDFANIEVSLCVGRSEDSRDVTMDFHQFTSLGVGEFVSGGSSE